ncbi:hypothetical protein [Pseudolysinimonas sp.]|uniref:hypothetical protein n=1 Tax=Pseudolysinimonas sp. TaxID=2680009 RepID=UPI00326519FE
MSRFVVVPVVALAIVLGVSSCSLTPGSPVVAASQPAAQTVTYTSPDFGYSVDFGGTAVESSVPQSVGGYNLVIKIASWTGGDRVQTVSALKFPDGLISTVNDALLTASLEGAATSSQGTLSDQKFIDVDGERGASGTVTVSSGVVRVVVFFHDGAQFTISTVNGSQDQQDSLVGSFVFGA